MGRKVHPVGFRVGVIRDWQAKWYADKDYVALLQEDLKLRKAIKARYADAGISLVEIDRQGDKILINIHTARPGVVIGRGGQRVDEMRQYLESLVGSRVQLNIQEVRRPELDAFLVAVNVAEQIGRRVAYRRAMKQAIGRTIEAGAKGMRISCSGRLAGAEIARREVMHQGQVPLHKLRADIDYGFTEAHTTLGRIGVKVWIYKGDILPEAVTEEVAGELVAAAEAAEPVVEEAPVTEAELVRSEEEAEAESPVAELIKAEPPVAAETPAPEAEVEKETVAEVETPVAAAEVTETEPETPAEVEDPAAEAEAAATEKPARKKKAAEKSEAEAPAAEAETTATEKPARKKKAAEKSEAEAPIAAVTETEDKDATTEAS